MSAMDLGFDGKAGAFVCRPCGTHACCDPCPGTDVPGFHIPLLAELAPQCSIWQGRWDDEPPIWWDARFHFPKIIAGGIALHTEHALRPEVSFKKFGYRPCGTRACCNPCPGTDVPGFHMPLLAELALQCSILQRRWDGEPSIWRDARFDFPK